MSRYSGDKSELLACAWLIGEGYEVFRNVAARGPIDIVAIKDGVVLKLDVKTTQLSPVTGERQGGKISARQIEMGVLPLHVLPDGTCTVVWTPTAKAAERSFNCEHCGSPTSGRRERQRFCSKACGRLRWRAVNGRRKRADLKP